MSYLPASVLRFRVLCPLLFIASVAACGDDDGPPADPDAFVPVSDTGPEPDAGDEDTGAMDTCEGMRGPEATPSPSPLGTLPGVERTLSLDFLRDACRNFDFTLSSSDESIATVPARTTIAARQSRARVPVTGVAPGRATITATWTLYDGTEGRTQVDVIVANPSAPACSGDATARVAPGEEVTGTGALSLAALAVPAGAATAGRWNVAPFDATIACAGDIVPDGYVALGAAVRFGPEHSRFPREVELAVPARLAALPQGAHRGHVELAYSGPSISARLVALTSASFDGTPDDGALRFETDRLGTYQAVVRANAGSSRRMRRYTFHGITGASMGGGGSALIGSHHLDRFDMVAPLGGPTDWVYMLRQIREYQLGGFCTAAERASDPEGCAMGSSLARVTPTEDLYEITQHYEHWSLDDDYLGPSPIFDRNDYTKLFRDLGRAFGNFASHNPPNHLLPVGVPDEELSRPNDQRCAESVVIPSGYYDARFNPDGSLPVITFCEGDEVEGDIGLWMPGGRGNFPVESGLAVDIDGNGRRDSGEPVMNQSNEPWSDVGADGLASPAEAGYDPVTNPDPAGDDYEPRFNPRGTERNWVWDEGEPFDDVGLDGVAGTPQQDEGGYDIGEGNGVFDESAGRIRMRTQNARSHFATADASVLRDVEYMADAGIRDLFNFAPATEHMMGGLLARGLPVRIWNGFSRLQYTAVNDDELVNWTLVPWDEVGQYGYVRYGHLDATVAELRQGDGNHTGSTLQLVNRLQNVMAWMSARWPGGDRSRLIDMVQSDEGAPCADPINFCTFDFTSPTLGRDGEVSLVLPPGYWRPENAELRYPIIYLMHGYGMSPRDLIGVGLIMWNQMTAATIPEARRLQKMIMVFPDGDCRRNECITGTFYTDSPRPEGAQMETFLVDLADYLDANYRTRRPEMIEVTE